MPIMKSDVRVDDLPDDLQSLIDEGETPERPSIPSTPLQPAEPAVPPFRPITDSILYTVKKMLGISQEYLAFDTDIIVNINSAFFTLYQLGVGPYPPFSIEGPTETWTDFLKEDDPYFKSVRTYIYQKVRLAFDPPSAGFQLEAIKQQIAEYEWRFTVNPTTWEDYNGGKEDDSSMLEMTREEVKKIYEEAKAEAVSEANVATFAATPRLASAQPAKLTARNQAIKRVIASRKTPKELFR